MPEIDARSETVRLGRGDIIAAMVDEIAVTPALEGIAVELADRIYGRLVRRHYEIQAAMLKMQAQHRSADLEYYGIPANYAGTSDDAAQGPPRNWCLL